MEVLRVLGFVREGLTSNLWGLGCPIHCYPSTLPGLALAFVLGWICGFVCLGYLAFRLGLWTFPHPSEAPPQRVPSPEASALRLRSYLHATGDNRSGR